jgi:hypothetical protein
LVHWRLQIQARRGKFGHRIEQLAGAQQTTQRKNIARDEVVARNTSHLEEAALGWNSAALYDHTGKNIYLRTATYYKELYEVKNS